MFPLLGWILLFLIVGLILLFIYLDYISSILILNALIRYRKEELISSNVATINQNISNPKICLVSGSITPIGKANRQFAEISKHRLFQYAYRHGYTVQYFTQPYAPTAPLIWQKVYAMDAALHQNYDVVVWVDDDIYITNVEKPIQDFLSLSEKDIIIGQDITSTYYNFLNTGIYILRNTPISRKLIQDTLQARTKLFNGLWNEGYYHEQSVITYFILTTYRQYAYIVEKNILQSYSKDGLRDKYNFCLHLAGEKTEDRNRIMLNLMNQTSSNSFG